MFGECASVSGCVCAGVQLFTSVCGCVQVYAGMHGYVPVYVRVSAGGVWVYEDIHGCKLVCVGVCRCVHGCLCVCEMNFQNTYCRLS